MTKGLRIAYICLVALTFGAACLAPPSKAAPGDRLDRSRLKLTFAEEFDRPLEWWSDEAQRPHGKRWRTGFEHTRWPKQDTLRSRFLEGESQIYIDPKFRGSGINPFEVSNDQLTITARPTTSDEARRLDGKTYVSGLLTTAHAFQQVYGYFEMKAKLPAGPGWFPAFWLFSFSGRTEIDVMECLTGAPRVLYNGAIFKDPAGKPTKFNRITFAEANPGPDLTSDFHSFGVLWTFHSVTFFLDDVEQWSIPNVPPGIPATPGFHEPMYMLVNLAVGGSWNAAKKYSPSGEGKMVIEHVRAYELLR